MDSIKDKIEAYKSALQIITENRALWTSSIKALIYDTLLEVKGLSDLDWRVQKVDMLQNLEAVNIHFNKQPSGFVQKRENGNESMTKYGGSLAFSQAYNGEVFTIITYPYVPDWVSEMDTKTLSKTSPHQITKDVVLAAVGKFLDEMIKWESSTSRTMIGFDTSGFNKMAF